jgi:hypothetical protein
MIKKITSSMVCVRSEGGEGGGRDVYHGRYLIEKMMRM